MTGQVKGQRLKTGLHPPGTIALNVDFTSCLFMYIICKLQVKNTQSSKMSVGNFRARK